MKEKKIFLNNNKLIVIGDLLQMEYTLPEIFYIINKKKIYMPKIYYNFFKNKVNFLIKSSNKLWFYEIKLEGRGFKLFKYKGYLCFDLGYSNLFTYKNINNRIKLHITKYKITVSSNNKEILLDLIFNLNEFYKIDKYHGKGIYTLYAKKKIYKKLM